MIYLKLFFEFFKTGLFSIGGGMATVPFLFSMCEKTGWFTASELANMIAVSESTPGPVGVNMSTYVGYTVAGIPGSLISTLGIVLPSYIIIILIARILQKFRNSPLVDNSFNTLRPAVIGLIGYAVVTIASITFFDAGTIVWPSFIAFAVIFILIRVFKKIHPVIWIAIGAVFGLIAL